MGPWASVVTVLPGAPVGDDDPTLTGDLLELYFNRSDDIYVSTRASVGAAWGAPARVDELSSVSIETTPEITSDGLTIFIGTDRSPTTGGEDVWFSTRPSRSAAWGAPVHVDQLSSGTDNAAAAPTDDLLALVQIGSPSGDVDLYMSTRASVASNWGTPARIGNVNSNTSDFSPMLSQDRVTLYFDSFRAGGDDLYVATRSSATAGFDVPVVISELSTTTADESDPWASPDGHHMFFVRGGVLYEASR